ncbi:hypothetical protein BHU72_09285 [Desulfuribacillus stibiiarsenatis]|uniref:4Fe-4S Mo/W bis-MGD-type domain-containing protein n=1 Tax=Desulfuribacillus stibiiarsenatis TaxID=1390249 RepID=A0A1E5L2L4_9FIRM|nr:molybdopterin-dependent oxidoreductase [Desulfuribacillus stibiiarsenatis]OEH84402.1 hypothetical protein BHU72_09285 [Desulfuribacillus stibiiarsenatis]
MFDNRVSRRTFLKATVATGASVTVGTTGLLSYEQWLEASENAVVYTKNTLCNGCTNRCGMIVSVKNGRVWRAKGNPDCSNGLGTLCGRGQAMLDQPYATSGYRVTQPMKKVGDNEFEPISWEQAFSEIGAKFKDIIQKHGSETLFIGQNPKAFGTFYLTRLADALQIPTRVTHNPSCNTARNSAMPLVYGAVHSSDINNAKYIVYVGRSPADGMRPNQARSLRIARDNGAQIVILDPRYSNSCAFGSKWVNIRPGTDLAFLLAVMHVLIKDDLYDKKFVEEYTIGFAELAEEMKKYTPEWAAEITDVPADTIIEVANGLGANKPASLIEEAWKGSVGCSYENSSELGRAMACINGLLGNIGKKGGIRFSSDPEFGKVDGPSPKAPKGLRRLDEVGAGDTFPFTVASQGVTHLVVKKAIDGITKGGIVRQNNIARNFAGRDVMVKGLKSMECLVVIDIFMTETAECADYILPEPTFLERREIVENKGMRVCITDQVIDKIYPDTKPLDEIVAGIAKAAGVSEFFNFTLDQLNEARLKPLGIAYKDLLEKGYITYKQPQKEPVEGEVEKFVKTPSGLVEFFSEKCLKENYPPVVRWVPPLVSPDPSNLNEFRLIWGKYATHTHTATITLPSLAYVSKISNADWIWMSSKRAKTLGIKHGDLVIVENEQHTAKLNVKVTERLHPDCIFMPGHFGQFATRLPEELRMAANPNDFTPFMMEKFSGTMNAHETLVRVRKA